MPSDDSVSPARAGPYTEKYFSKTKPFSNHSNDGLYRPKLKAEAKPAFQEALVSSCSEDEVGVHLKFTTDSKEGTFGQAIQMPNTGGSEQDTAGFQNDRAEFKAEAQDYHLYR